MSSRYDSNDQAHLPAGRGELCVTDNLHAPPVRCSAWFGLLTLNAPLFFPLPSVKARSQ